MNAPRLNPQPGHPCPAALGSVRSPIRIVDWPAFWFFGLAMCVLGFVAGAAIVGAFTLPATTTPVTVQLGQTVLECIWHEDPANHLRSLSC